MHTVGQEKKKRRRRAVFLQVLNVPAFLKKKKKKTQKYQRDRFYFAFINTVVDYRSTCVCDTLSSRDAIYTVLNEKYLKICKLMNS